MFCVLKPQHFRKIVDLCLLKVMCSNLMSKQNTQHKSVKTEVLREHTLGEVKY